MSGFDYHTGYLPGVENGMRKQRIRRAVIFVAVSLLIFFWINGDDQKSPSVGSPPMSNLQKTTVIKKWKEVQASQEPILVEAVEAVEAVIEPSSNDSINQNASLSAIQQSYENDLELLLNDEVSFSQ